MLRFAYHIRSLLPYLLSDLMVNNLILKFYFKVSVLYLILALMLAGHSSSASSFSHANKPGPSIFGGRAGDGQLNSEYTLVIQQV